MSMQVISCTWLDKYFEFDSFRTLLVTGIMAHLCGCVCWVRWVVEARIAAFESQVTGLPPTTSMAEVPGARALGTVQVTGSFVHVCRKK